jgi:hypothetical protein
MRTTIRTLGCCVLLAVLGAVGSPAFAATAEKIDANVTAALRRLYADSPTAKMLGEKAKGILVFPGIIKGGLIVGAQYGQGALRKEGKTAGYYKTVAASYGLQAGGQKFGYALFFMDDDSLKYLDKSGGYGPERGRRRQGSGQVAGYDRVARGRVCLHLRPEGAHGGHRHPGVEDHPHHARREVAPRTGPGSEPGTR